MKYLITILIAASLFSPALSAISDETESDEKAQGTVTLGSFTADLAGNPLVAGSTGQVLMAFSLTSDGVDSLNSVTITNTFTSQEQLVGATIRLVVSDDMDLDESIDYAIGTVSAPDANTLLVSGIEEEINTSTRYFYLISDVSQAVDHNVAAMEFTITPSNVTLQNGTVTGESITSQQFIFETVCASNDRQALINLFNATAGGTWTQNDSWTNGTHLSDWYGVETNEQGCVNQLLLSNNNLIGELPEIPYPALQDLFNLDLAVNQISGSIPNSIGDLQQLSAISLQSNKFSGDIPSSIYRLQNAGSLNLSNNELTGKVSNSIANMTNLNVIDLSGNLLDGELPRGIGSITNLQYLYLTDNYFDSRIPGEYENLTNLVHFSIAGNSNVHGSLPGYFMSFSNLTGLFLDATNLEGTIPESIISLTMTDFDIRSTGLCEPTSTAYTNWTTTISNYGSSGVSCTSVKINGLTNGIATGPLGGGNTDAGLIGFSITSETTTNMTGLAFDYFGDASVLTNIRLVRSADADYTTAGDNTIVASVLEDGGFLVVNALNEPIGPTPTFFYLVAEISSTVSEETTALEIALDASRIILSNSETVAPTYLYYGSYNFESAQNALDRAALEAIYYSSNGPGWNNSDNWLTKEPLRHWHGVTQSGLIAEYWFDVDGSSLADFTSRPDFPNIPESYSDLESFDIDQNIGDNYGVRVRGVFVAPESGDYTFWIAGDDEYELYLSSNNSNTNISLIASGTSVSKDNWTASTSQMSSPITLVAGTEYYIEARFIEFGGDDHLSVGWTLPSDVTTVSGPTQIIPSSVFVNDKGVVGLELGSNNLGGVLDDAIGDLTDLELLDLSSNAMAGAIPTTVANLNNLIKLDLSLNFFSAEMPAAIGNMAQLRHLDLYYNNLSGPIPTALGNLVTLEVMDLHGNAFSGGIPIELGNLSNLQILDLGSNQLSGEIPGELGNLSNLSFLSLLANNLSGGVPTSFNTLTNLQVLTLRTNELTGSFPDFSNLSNIRILSIRGNNFSGEVPSYLNNLTSLEQLLISNNAFTGQLPDLQNLTNLNTLWVHNNPLTGPIPTTFSALTSMTQFAYSGTGLCAPTDASYITWKEGLGDQYYSNGYTCSNASFTGIFDEERLILVEAETDVPLFKWNVTSESGGTFDGITFNYTADLNNNELSNFRVIQSTDNSYETTSDNTELTGLTIVEGTNFVSIDGFAHEMSSTPVYYILIADVAAGVNYNNGYVQLEVSQDELRSTNITFNETSWYSADYFFESICADDARGILTELYETTGGKSWWGNDYWTNAVPLYNWSGVTTTAEGCVTGLSLGGNNLNGPIPGTLGDLTALTDLNLSDNNLYGEIPVNFQNYTDIVYFDLGRNNLSGGITDIFSNWTAVQTIGLAGNNLTGEIPASMGNLTTLINLYLDFNSLSGELPETFDNLVNLQQLYIQSNDLTGAFPIGLTESGTLLSVGFENTNICEPTGSTQYNDWKTNVINNGFFSGTDIGCSSETSILSFAFQEDPAVGDFTGAPLITFTVASTTNEQFLTADFSLSAGATAYVSGVEQESGVTVNDFRSDVVYQVIAQDGGTTEEWTIRVDRDVNNQAEITSFSLPEQTGPAVFSGTADEIDIEVIYGSDRSALVPEFILSAGATARVNNEVQESGVSTVDFSSGSATYEVTSEDLSSVRNWLVNVSMALNDSTDFLSFNLSGPDVTNVEINTFSHEINVDIAFYPDLDAIVTDFTVSGDAQVFVSGTERFSGEEFDYTSGTVQFTVRAQNGEEQIWTVNVNVAPNTATDFIVFSVPGEVSQATPDTDNHTIDVELQLGSVLNNVTPTFELSEGANAYISGNLQTSGSSSVNFESGPVVYDIVAQDEVTSQAWTITMTVQVDEEAPQITAVTTPEIYSLGSGGFDVAATATDNFGLDNVQIFYKKTSGVNFTPEQLTGLGESYVKRFNDFDLDNIGVDYYFVATDEAGNESSTNVFTTNTFIGDDSQTIPHTSGTTVENYRIIAFPFDDPDESALTNTLGAYDKKKWRLLRWQGSRYQDFDAFNSLSSGVGYFFLSRDEVQINIGGQSVNITNGEYSMPLNAVGYNLIGNPFMGTLTWSEVIDYNIANGYISSGDVSSTIVGYVSGYTNKSTMSPYEGAWVQVNSSVPNFVIPTTASNGVSRLDQYEQSTPASFDLDDPSWEMNFYLSGEKLVYNVGGVGVNPSASQNEDPLDLKTLPQLSTYLNLEIDNQFARSIKPGGETIRWALTVNSNLPDKELTLKWDKPVSDLYSIILIDKNNQQLVDLSTVGEMTITNTRDAQYELVYGRTAEIFEQLNLDFSTISLLYPNPVEDHVNIELYSHEAGVVNCELLSLSGQVLQRQDFVTSKGLNALRLEVLPGQQLEGMMLISITTTSGRTISSKIIKK